MRVAKGHWVWGQFDQASTEELNSMKDTVNTILKGPVFEPHLTLGGPLNEYQPRTTDRFHSLATKVKSTLINPLRYAYKNEYFQSLFVEIEKTKELLDLKKSIDNTFGLTSDDYFPHISLYYGHQEELRKKELLKLLNKLSQPIYVDKIVLVDVDENIESWRVVHEQPIQSDASYKNKSNPIFGGAKQNLT